MAPRGFPATLSPSRASDFLTCPLLFRYRSIDRFPQQPTPAQLRGTMVHRALETLFVEPAHARTVDRARVLLAEAWVELAGQDELGASVLLAELGLPADAAPAGVADAVVAPALGLLDTYFALEDPRRLEPHARELGVNVELEEGFAIRGFIDRVDRAPAGQIRIVDYKTGRSPSPAFESKAMFQMRFYALAWWRMTGDIPAMLQLLYLGNGQTLRYEPDEAALASTERKILALRDAIAKAAEAGRFPATPSRLCDWCDHRSICPAWGGTEPPLPPDEDWVSTASPAEAIGVEQDVSDRG